MEPFYLGDFYFFFCPHNFTSDVIPQNRITLSQAGGAASKSIIMTALQSITAQMASHFSATDVPCPLYSAQEKGTSQNAEMMPITRHPQCAVPVRPGMPS